MPSQRCTRVVGCFGVSPKKGKFGQTLQEEAKEVRCDMLGVRVFEEEKICSEDEPSQISKNMTASMHVVRFGCRRATA